MIPKSWTMTRLVVPPPGRKATAAARARTMRMLTAAFTPPSTLGQGDRLLVGRPGRVEARRPGFRSRIGLLGREPVPDAEMRVDVPPAGRGLLELLAHLAHEDVHRAIAVGHGPAPDPLVDLLAREDTAIGVGDEMQELELALGQVDRNAVAVGLELVGADDDLPRLDLLGRRRGGAGPAAGGGLDAGRQLLGMAGLVQPVVGAEAQAADALGHRGGAAADD